MENKIKKTISKILFIILCIFLFETKVFAANMHDTTCDMEELGGGATNVQITFDLDGIFQKQTGHFYTASIGGQNAFCLNSGKKRAESYHYVGKLNEIYGDYSKFIAASYNWYSQNSGLENRKIAQIMIWIAASMKNKYDSTGDSKYSATRLNSFLENSKLPSNPSDYYCKSGERCVSSSTYSGVKQMYDSSYPLYQALTSMFVVDDWCSNLESSLRVTSGNFNRFRCSMNRYDSFLDYCNSEPLCRSEYLSNNQFKNVQLTREEYTKCRSNDENTYRRAYQQLSDRTSGSASEAINVSKRQNSCKMVHENRSSYPQNAPTALLHYEMWYKIHALSVNDFGDYILSNAGVSMSDTVSRITSNEALSLMKRLSTSSDNGSNLEVWCADDEWETLKSNPKKITANQLVHQCFVVKTPNSCESCKDLLNGIKTKYGYGTTRFNSNNLRYQEELKALYSKFNEQYENLLNYDNPECKGTPTTTTDGCQQDLENLKTKYNFPIGTIPMSELQALKNKYPAFTGLLVQENPACSIIPPCLPKYNDTACGININDIGGIYMADSSTSYDIPSDYCIYNSKIAYSTINGSQTQTSTDITLGSSYNGRAYCTVQCWESFKVNFPGAGKETAGQIYFWGLGNKSDGNYGNITAKRICRTSDINYTQLRTDWDANEADIVNKYNSYKAQYDYNRTATTYDSSEACTITTSCPSGNYTPAGKVLAINEAGELYWADTEASCSGCPSGYTLSGTSCQKTGTRYKRNAISYGGQSSTTGDTGCVDGLSNSEIDAKLDDYSTESSRENQLKTAINKRATIQTAIYNCQTTNKINAETIYDFKTKVTLKYNSNASGSNKNIPASQELEQRIPSKVLIPSGIPTGETMTLEVTDIPYSYPTISTFTINKYVNYNWDFKGIWNFGYPSGDQSNFLWNALKSNAHVVNNAHLTNSNVAHYDVGYGIPIAFSTITGYYDIETVVEGFGSYGNHFDILAQEKHISSYNYACKFKVENKLYGNECEWDCDDATHTCTLRSGSPDYCNGGVKGIDLVYRVIELNKDEKIVFPGLIGTGRKQGENWATFIQNKRTWFTNIMNYDLIYDNEPIYSIDLTPSLIQEIRADNRTYRQARKDPYTSFTNASNALKVHCEGETVNQTCASDWISDLIGRGLLTGQYCTSSNTNERLESIKTLKNQYDGVVR